MQFAVIGAAGKAGRLITAEAISRGHEVTAIIRPGSEDRAPAGAKILAKSLFDLTAADLEGFEAVVSAFGTPFDQPERVKEHVLAAKHLISVFKDLPKTRIIFIGGAGSLYTDESQTSTILDGMPEFLKNGVPGAAKEALELFRESNVNWSFFSPAYTFDSKGARSGSYTLGGDVKILNRVGKSYISYADAAIALVDEAETGAHTGKRFTAVSGDPYFRDMEQYFNIERYMFSRAGCWLGLKIDDPRYGKGALTLSTSRGMRTHRRPDGVDLFRIYPTYEGKRVPFAVHQMCASELTLHTLWGDVRFTWADQKKLMAEGDVGMGLLWTRDGTPYECVKPRKDNGWEVPVRAANPLCFKGLEGSTFRFKDTYDWYKLSNGEIHGYTEPGPDGRFTMVCEEFDYPGKIWDSYPTYAEGKASMQADFDDYLSKFPKFIEPYAAKREDTAYVLWTHLVAPTQATPKWMIMMFPTEMATQWQLVQNAVVMQDNIELARDLLLAPLERQGEDGQLADAYDEAFISTGSIKPPVYGWALKNILAHHDLTKEWSREDLERLYVGAGKWADWFMEYRDDDGDGLPGFEGGNENGFDEVTTYFDTVSMATPDLCAYQVLNFEAQGDLAKLMGKPQEEVDAWYNKAKTLLDKMIEKMWDGEHFVALKQYTHEPVFTGSNLHYLPIMLGNRLPAEIVDKMCADLLVEGKLLSDYGLTSDYIDSDIYEITGVKMGCGPISPPGQLFILTGLWEAGKKDEAKMIFDRYANRLMNGGFCHFIDPLYGDGSRFWGTWCRVVFTVIARMISEG